MFVMYLQGFDIVSIINSCVLKFGGQPSNLTFRDFVTEFAKHFAKSAIKLRNVKFDRCP